jgi:predicted nucleic acid-binding protein
MMMAYLIGEKPTVDKLNLYTKSEEMVVTAITLADIAMTLGDESVPHKIADNFEVLPFDLEAALKSMEIYKIMQENGNEKLKIAYNAAIVINNSAVMLTRDRKRYIGVPDLKLI